MDKKELMIELGKLHKTICIKAGGKTLGECSNFLQDGIISSITLKKSFDKFENDKQQFNIVKRLKKISDDNLRHLNELKIEAEKLNLMNYKFQEDLHYQHGYYS